MKRLVAGILIAAFALMFVALLSGCAGQAAPRAWVEADRARLNAIAPEYRAYYNADDSLSLEDRARRDRTLEAWEADVSAHEAAIKAGTGQ